jgi:hypothetical protein
MKNFLFLSVCILSFTACGNQNQIKNQSSGIEENSLRDLAVLGTWKAENSTEDYNLTLSIKSDSVTANATCQGNKQVSVTSTAWVSDQNVAINANLSENVGQDCSVTLRKAEMNYEIVGDQLVMTDSVKGSTTVFNRE